MSNAPIIIFAYNRAKHLEKTVKALLVNEIAKQSDLYIFIDGPKNGTDQMSVEVVKEYVSKIAGFKNIFIQSSNKNKGLANSVIDGVTEVLKKHLYVIVLEDDVVVSSNFLNYMNDALKNYKDNQNIFTISGLLYNGIALGSEYAFDTFTHPRFSSVAWATWRNRWEKADWSFLNADIEHVKGKLDVWGKDLFQMLKAQQSGKIDSWAIRWVYNHIINDAVSVFPTVSKAKHIGDDHEGTHVKTFLSSHRPTLDKSNKKDFEFCSNLEVMEQIKKEFEEYKKTMKKDFNIIETIFSMKEIIDEPPVLIDIGASGEIHKKWKKIAQYSICIAFDPDLRDVENIKKNCEFKKVYFIDSLVLDKNIQNTPFYLTKSPYCSSVLKPLSKALEDYSFYDLFKVERIVNVKAITLDKILEQIDLKKIDWFKSDSQGVDLRIFKGFSKKDDVLVAEFEPGIIDVYENEDKLVDVMSYMDRQNFWMSECFIKGDVRINRATREKYFNELESKNLSKYYKNNPGWAEVTYVNDFKLIHSKRDLLLGIVFNYLEDNIAFAIELCDKGMKIFDEHIFELIMEYLLLKKSVLALSIDEQVNFDRISHKIDQLTSKEKIAIYGFGTLGYAIYNKYKNSMNIATIIDNAKVGQKIDEHSISSINSMTYDNQIFVITVLNQEAVNTIKAELTAKFQGVKIIVGN